MHRGKPRWDLFLWGPAECVVRVFEFGAKKRAPWDFRKLPERRLTYFTKALRHMLADVRGERLDPESGLPHVAHAVADLLIWLDSYVEEGQCGEKKWSELQHRD